MDFANQNHKWTKTQIFKNLTQPKDNNANETEIILQTQFIRTWAEKRQANIENLHNQPRTKPKPRNKANQNRRRPKRKSKTLKSVLATRPNQPETLLTKENLLNEKAKLENLLIENQTQTQFEKTPPLKTDFEFLN